MRNFEINPNGPLEDILSSLQSWRSGRFWKKSQGIINGMEYGTYRSDSRYVMVRKGRKSGWIRMSDEDRILGTEVASEVDYTLDEFSGSLSHLVVKEERQDPNTGLLISREFMGTAAGGVVEMGLGRQEVIAKLGLAALIAIPENREVALDLLQLPQVD